uniref:Uncharacterized protein n=1 Tax=Arundo donax TaxID=35708 RepID=A0A0A9HHT7_ARUDO
MYISKLYPSYGCKTHKFSTLGELV